jgi:hypothetical protein
LLRSKIDFIIFSGNCSARVDEVNGKCTVQNDILPHQNQWSSRSKIIVELQKNGLVYKQPLTRKNTWCQQTGKEASLDEEEGL